MVHYEYEIVPEALSYYERTSDEDAIRQAKELIAEWDYDRDPHGYCHTRPMLVRLVEYAVAGDLPETGEVSRG